jgi:2-isopropylmalate synthase
MMVFDERKILIYDTTLRDGEQSPGAAMNSDEKLRMAVQLERLGVDIIEAGFPASSKGDFESVRVIAEKIRSVEIAAIARATIKDIDFAWQAIRDAAKPRIHIFFSSSDIHLKYQLKKTRGEALQHIKAALQHACKYTDNVEFSATDAARAEQGFLCEMLEAAIYSGARTVNIADTVGYAVPGELGILIDYLFEEVRGIENVVLSVHCHNDLGLAVANTLAAVEHGARQVKCTVNGIGERAGNAALEEVVMALQTRKNFFNVVTGIRTEHIYETSRLLTEITGIAVQPNKAIVGANAFAHESGVHQDGIMKERSTYEIITPKSVGAPETRLVLGKHSGRHAVEARLIKMGYTLTSKELNRVFHKFKEYAHSLTDICDNDLVDIIHREIHGKGEPSIMRVSKKAIKDTNVIIRLLADSHVGRLGTFGKDGYPMIKPLNFVYREGKIYFHSAQQGEKIDNIKRNSRVCFEVDLPITYVKSEGSPCRADYLYRSVIIRGRAKIVDDKEERFSALKELMKKYQPEGGFGDFQAEKLALTAVVRIDIKEMTGKEDLGKETERQAVLELLARDRYSSTDIARK